MSVGADMSDKRGIQWVKEWEGFRDRIYFDQYQNLTVGWGHLLKPGGLFPKDACQILFRHDYEQAEKDYDRLGLSLDPIRRIILIDLLFNMGLSRVLKFEKMLAALKRRDFDSAAQELMDSKYFRKDHNCRGRALRNAEVLRTGVL